MRIFVTGSIAYDYIMVFPGPVSGPHPAGQDARPVGLVSGRLADAEAGWHRGEYLPTTSGYWANGRCWWARSATTSPSIALLESLGVDCRTGQGHRRRAHSVVLHQHGLAG